VTLAERIDRLEDDATAAYDLGDFVAYDRIVDELVALEQERESWQALPNSSAEHTHAAV
jgi:hypothetical protein